MLHTLKLFHPFEKKLQLRLERKRFGFQAKTNKEKTTQNQKYRIFKPTFETKEINVMMTCVRSMK